VETHPKGVILADVRPRGEWRSSRHLASFEDALRWAL